MVGRTECTCASGLYPRPLVDARGVFCCYVCDDCEGSRRARYRPEIFSDPDYWHDEPIDDD